LFSAIVSFGKVNPEHKEKVEQNGLSIYSWEEFIQLVIFSPADQITDDELLCYENTTYLLKQEKESFNILFSGPFL
jgi:hypothetical protein